MNDSLGSKWSRAAGTALPAVARSARTLTASFTLTLAATLTLALTACGGGGGGGGAVADPAPPPVAVVSSLGDFPDPFVFADGRGGWLAVATNSGNRNVQMARSANLQSWQSMPDAMPQRASWTANLPGLVWAPEVVALGGRWLMYYTARDAASNRQCIGVAEAAQPEGPYVDPRSAPLVCQVADGGSIDPSPLQLGSELFLYFKNDGNCCNRPTTLWGQRLAADGLSVQGQPVALLTTAAAWEGAVIEAPTMWSRQGQLHLFYSGGDYLSSAYAAGHALCNGPLGPCTRSGNGPILASRNDTKPPLIGPGHQALVQAGDQTWFAYHAWEVTAQGTRGSRRFMYLDRVDWSGPRPTVGGPTMVP
jgi:beta-xylosidase